MAVIIEGLGTALNYATFGLLEHAARSPGRGIEDHKVFGLNGANVFSYIPLFNFVIGANRIAMAAESMDKFKGIAVKNLYDTQAKQRTHAVRHVLRGVVELIPGASLAIFLLPDLLFSAVRFAMWLLKPEEAQSKEKALISEMNGLLKSLKLLKRESSSKKTRTAIAENKEAIRFQARKYMNCLNTFQNLPKKSTQDSEEEIPSLDENLPKKLLSDGSSSNKLVLVPKKIETGADLNKMANDFADEIISYDGHLY